MLSNHPKGLMTLFFTEMWERFGFYTMLAVFTLYMDEVLGWSDAYKGQVYGFFLAFVYFTPIAGVYPISQQNACVQSVDCDINTHIEKDGGQRAAFQPHDSRQEAL